MGNKTLAGTRCTLRFTVDFDTSAYTWHWYAQDKVLDDATTQEYDSLGAQIADPPKRALSAASPDELGAGVVTAGLSDGSMLGFINKLKENIESHESVGGGERIATMAFQLWLNWGGTHQLRTVSWSPKRKDPDDGSSFPPATTARPAPLLAPRDLISDELGAAATEGDVDWFAATCRTAIEAAEGIT